MTISKLLTLTALFVCSLAQAKDLSTIKKIECDRMDNANDHYVITPNVFKKGERTYAALSGDFQQRILHEEDGRVDYAQVAKDNFFYEVIYSRGAIVLKNNNHQFENNRQLTLTTSDYVTGKLFAFAMQPGVGGYGRDGIPQGTTRNLVYNCRLLSR